MPRTDFLVIGSGIAGLTYALKLAEKYPEKKVTILTKAKADESNTQFAQGGIAVVWDGKKDNAKKHINDTLRAGDGLCNPEVVEMAVSEGPDRLKELIRWGVVFDQNATQKLHLGLEGGHSEHRIVHSKDRTGASVIETLLARVYQQKNIDLHSHLFTIDLLLDRSRSACVGALAVNTQTSNIETFQAPITMLATGGAGRIYKNTTNPSIATGDGIAMAFRAGARIRDMEFVQFHPTALFETGNSEPFLISEAIRGAGAHLRNHQSKRFMAKYDERGELASRDIVARAIHAEMLISGKDHVYLDCRHIDHGVLNREFPGISAKCAEKNIDLRHDMIPVAPSAHFICGGIAVNEWGQTTVSGLFAAGETACSGLHGANRLASNSLLEALVFAHRAYIKSVELTGKKSQITVTFPSTPSYAFTTCDPQFIQKYRTVLQDTMSLYAGILRTTDGLRKGLSTVRLIKTEVYSYLSSREVCLQIAELQNMVKVAELILSQSLKRKENRGVFYNSDLEPVNDEKSCDITGINGNSHDLYHTLTH